MKFVCFCNHLHENAKQNAKKKRREKTQEIFKAEDAYFQEQKHKIRKENEDANS